ncbi:MAG: hypothetical protein QJR13_07850 [Bacillota bacterium]|nr:hypothetical protein [Bacillota bacterium]
MPAPAVDDPVLAWLLDEAVTLLEARRRADGRWLLEREVSNMHTARERKGRPSRWIAYRARRALRLWREGRRSR